MGRQPAGIGLRLSAGLRLVHRVGSRVANRMLPDRAEG